METEMSPDDRKATEAVGPAGAGEAAGPLGAAPPGAGGPFRGRLVSGWRFARHLLEMVVAMLAGMAALGVAIWALGEPPGYANLLVEYGLMGVAMSVTMVAWMRYRGHSWRDGGEMTAAMLVPTFALVAPVELGVAVPGLSEGSLMMLSHVAMVGGMAALMVYRFDLYAHGTRDHYAQDDHRTTTS
jgi:hypothetical protein